jgi:hypothetical protein
MAAEKGIKVPPPSDLVSLEEKTPAGRKPIRHLRPPGSVV